MSQLSGGQHRVFEHVKHMLIATAADMGQGIRSLDKIRSAHRKQSTVTNSFKYDPTTLCDDLAIRTEFWGCEGGDMHTEDAFVE